jgi:hypothetical protein
MAIKKKRLAGRAAKKSTNRKRVAAKKASPKKDLRPRDDAQRRQSTRKKRPSKSAAVRRKERKVEEAGHRLIDAEKELAVEELPPQVHPATKKRGADPHVPTKTKRKRPSNSKERKLEQGLEESMAGSDPISVTQPVMPIAEKPENNAEPGDDS